MKNDSYILIVEDSRTQARQLADILIPLGYRISIAGNGKEALALLNDHRPAIVVADIVMPEMDGYEMCKVMKSDSRFMDIPVLLLTQLSDPKEIIKGLESGADDFIVKPYNKELLMTRLQTLLSLNKTDTTDRQVNILIVEDSPTQAENLKYLLEDQGYTVAVATNGKEGLDSVRKNRPTLILSDILMPVMDGYELADAIKHDNELKDIPIILITSLTDRKGVASRAAVIADGYFTKPYDDSYLLSKIEFLLSASSRDREEKNLEGIEVTFEGEPYVINSGRRQILTFLLSTYENAVQQNHDLILMQRELQEINDRLEERVEERTGQLQNSKKRLETIIDSSEDIIFLKDRDLRYQIANKAHEKLFNIKVHDILGETDFDFMPKEVAEGCRKSDEQALIAPDSVDIEEYVMGRYYHALRQRITDEEGNVTGIVGIIRDVTSNKKIEEERIRSSKLESLGVLAGGIAHDFNNLLTGIIGNASLARMLCNPEDKVYKRLTELEDASLRAKDLTQQLLTFAKGGAPIKKTTSIASLLRDSATFAMRGSNITCDFSIPEDLSPVEVDEGQITQVIHNLIINAEQAMPKGGLIKVSAGNISVSPSNGLPVQDGEYIKITVSDTGIGIPKENLIRIFDPYFTTKEEGSGLGLATAYSIIKNHGGYVTAESESGAGTTFYIYLPASSHKEIAPEKVVEEEPIHGKGRLLVMDDEEIVRAVAEAILTELGYEVEFALDGASTIEAYKLAKKSGNPFDAVILDLTIPGGMGGKDTIKKLLEVDPTVKAIVSSGYSSDPIMSDFTKYGFSAVIAKPYKVAELSMIVHKVVTGE
ncbi:MAG TPA: response regulator [Thermodesulfobacteriota bacterium]|nr:response regulator [Thermodesulfobacteriota bacterium]